MKILAKRGFWNTLEERNTTKAIFRAFDCGYGIETDIRDYCGELVISHDVATESNPKVREIFQYYKEHKVGTTLALNVKADGIQTLLRDLLEEYDITNYFLFDMSAPEMVVYDKQNFRFFTRQSEIEMDPIMYDKAHGIWMDEWETSWITKEWIEKHLSNGLQMGIISPEVHGRDITALWSMLKDIKSDDVMLCTDKVVEATKYFATQD